MSEPLNLPPMRRELFIKARQKREQERRDARKKRKREEDKLGVEAPPRKIPRTIESTREADPTLIDPADEETQMDLSVDEFASYFTGVPPKTMITTNVGPTKHVMQFGCALAKVLYNATVFRRRKYQLQKIIQYAKNRQYTDLIVLNENRKKITDLIVCHLPNGPTARFKVFNVIMPEKIRNHGRPTKHPCELILNNFASRIGMTVGRMVACLFPQQPDFRGRRVATFHCQRDFIFFRHHRYVFEEATTEVQKVLECVDEFFYCYQKKAPVVTRLQELGPRFVLKLQSLQLGTLDTQHGEFMFVFKKELQESRRRFFL